MLSCCRLRPIQVTLIDMTTKMGGKSTTGKSTTGNDLITQRLLGRLDIETACPDMHDESFTPYDPESIMDSDPED